MAPAPQQPSPRSAGRKRTVAQVRQVANLAQRFARDARYRGHVLDVVQRMTQVHSSEVDVAARERDLAWLRGKRIFFIGGCEFTYIKNTFDELGAVTYHTFDHGGSSDPLGEALDPQSPLWDWKPDVVVLSQVQVATGLFHRTQKDGRAYSLDQQEADLAAMAGNYGRAADLVREGTGAAVFLLTYPLLYRPSLGALEYRTLQSNLSLAEMIRRYELAVYAEAKQRPDTYVVDVAAALELDGKRTALSGDTELLGEHFTREGSARVFDQLVLALSAITAGARKIKCAVFDLDDTLWSGVLRELGQDGVAVRQVYLRAARYLAARGILIALCSKNEPSEEQYLDALLGGPFSEVVVAKKLSWDLKSTAIRQLAEELNLGLDSFAFFDDNERERAEVRENLPEVLVLSDSDILRSLSMPEFQPYGVVTDDAVARTASYRSEAARTAAAASSPETRIEFLRSLDLTLELRRPEPGELDRVHELLSRTNQLNATLHRSTRGEITSQYQSPEGFDLKVAQLSDRFGDYGTIGAIATERAGDRWTIRELAFSCRAMGRGVELACLAELAGHARSAGAAQLTIDFVPTERNAQMLVALEEAGFTATGEAVEGDSRRLVLDLSDPPEVPSWFRHVLVDHR